MPQNWPIGPLLKWKRTCSSLKENEMIEWLKWLGQIPPQNWYKEVPISTQMHHWTLTKVDKQKLHNKMHLWRFQVQQKYIIKHWLKLPNIIAQEQTSSISAKPKGKKILNDYSDQPKHLHKSDGLNFNTNASLNIGWSCKT
jgi:hypothetical protein